MLFQATTRKFLPLLLLIGLIAGLSGCSSWLLGEFRDPRIDLIKVEVVRAKLLEQEFELFLRVDNPNAFDLPLSDLDYQVELNGIKLAEGHSQASFSIPANSQKVIRIPVQTNLWRHLKQVVKMLKKPDRPISYSLQGSVRVGAFFGRNVHLSRNGEIIPGDYIPE